MELDTGRPWRIFLADDQSPSGFVPPELLRQRLRLPSGCGSPAEFAATELASAFLSATGTELLPGQEDESDQAGIIILDAGGKDAGAPGRRGNFAWRAAPTRIEIHGGSPAALAAGTWDFLDAAGFAWPSPLSAPVLPSGKAGLALARTSGFRRDGLPRPVLILGHGSYLEQGAEYMLWAARNGYGAVFAHTTTEDLALGAAPLALYEARRGELASLAKRLGLELELGGHGLSALLPRHLFQSRPELFRMAEGKRRADRNFCAGNPETLELVGTAFVSFVDAHPEVDVFHVWPDDLPGGGWCSCPACAGLSPAAQSLRTAAHLAGLLEERRPGARLSWLAYHDTEDTTGALGGLAGESRPGEPRQSRLPASLQLLWAPRLRSWAKPYGDPSCALNRDSLARMTAAREAFARAATAGGATGGGATGGGATAGGRYAVFEYWEDAILFKAAVPPLPSVMAGDLEVYAGGPGLDRIGILLTGDRLPLAPRPNAWIFPRLLREAAEGPTNAAALMERFCGLAYGPAAEPMARYWKALEEAWAIDLDLEPGDSAVFFPEPLLRAATEPVADWGDPWKADAARLSARRERCDRLFSLLREAEEALASAEETLESSGGGPARAAVHGERDEYAIAGGILEASCARLSAYHEFAAGSPKAGADLALIARSILDGVYRAQRRVRDPRARRNGRFLLFLFLELRLRALSRRGSGPLAQLGVLATTAELALRASRLRRTWEPKALFRTAPGAAAKSANTGCAPGGQAIL